MNNKKIELYKRLEELGLSPGENENIQRELEALDNEHNKEIIPLLSELFPGLYDYEDFTVLQNIPVAGNPWEIALRTLDELLEKDKQREKDGFPRRIRLGKIVRKRKDSKGQVVIVPTTNDAKFYHDDSVTEEEDSTGGSGEGEEGEVIGEQEAQPQQGEGEGQGAGQGEGADHDISSEAFDLGKVLTEKFELPNLKTKGTKRSFTKYVYDLTDKNRGFGQLLDKKDTLRRIIKTNILLDKIKKGEPFSGENLALNPQDKIYRILSKEKDFESQAMVFFLRDYSGSMQGPPTEVITTQHLLIYSWLVYQYKNNVETRFIVHDTDSKEVEDFYTYYKSMVAGGTRVAPAFHHVNKIVEEEQLAKDYNIYIFYGTDGDDWDTDGKELIDAVKKMMTYCNRIGVTVARNTWGANTKTVVEKNFENSGLLKSKPGLIRLDSLVAAEVSEERIVEGIKKLVS